jgi:hypothetical protein
METDADPECRMTQECELFIIFVESVAHGECGANCIVGLPWVRLQGTEEGQDAVADEF